MEPLKVSPIKHQNITMYDRPSTLSKKYTLIEKLSDI